MEKIEYETCFYSSITHCPYGMSCKVGGFDCYCCKHFDKRNKREQYVICNFKQNNNMKTQKIIVPEGMEIKQVGDEYHIVPIKKEKKENVITHFPTKEKSDIHINGKWVGTLYGKELQEKDYKGAKLSGHGVSLFLTNCNGDWYNEEGQIVEGYLYYKPTEE